MSQAQWAVMIAIFGIAMFLIVAGLSRGYNARTTSGYLLADRAVPWTWGAPSIAASWIWAPALFVSIQKTYEFGIAGAFWFTAPNIAALLIYCVLAPRIRDALPAGYTFPGWIRHRFGGGRLHRLYLVPFVWYQLMAVCVQLLVGGLMLEYLTGIALPVLMAALLVLTLGYGLRNGMPASIVTDFFQMGMILFGVLLCVPMLVYRVGWGHIAAGMYGRSVTTGILDGSVAYSFGIVTTIGLVAGAVSDQQYWQRAYAIKRSDLRKAFAVGALLFGIVPGMLAVVGLIAASPDLKLTVPADTQLPMVGIAAVRALLPQWAVVVFVFMLLSGLASTLDSGLCAGASLYAVDLRQARASGERDASDARDSKVGMVLFAAGGYALAYVAQFLFSLDKLWWIFNGVASCFVVPTLLSVFWTRLSERGAFWGIIASLCGMIVFVYGNYRNDVNLIVGSAASIVFCNALLCWLLREKEA